MHGTAGREQRLPSQHPSGRQQSSPRAVVGHVAQRGIAWHSNNSGEYAPCHGTSEFSKLQERA